jgi:hypothetical protein
MMGGVDPGVHMSRLSARLLALVVAGSLLVPTGSFADEVSGPGDEAQEPGEVVALPTLRVHRCEHASAECLLPSGTVRMRWTIDEVDANPVEAISVSLGVRETNGTVRNLERHSLPAEARTIDFHGLEPGSDLVFSILLRRRDPDTGTWLGLATQALRFRMRDVVVAIPGVYVGGEADRPNRIVGWIAPAVDVSVYPEGVGYQLQRRLDGVWSDLQRGVWPSGEALDLLDTTCPSTRVCSYRIRNRYSWGNSAWSDVVSQRSVPAPTAPTLTASAMGAGRIEVAAATTLRFDWYGTRDYQLQRDVGAGWQAWKSGQWAGTHPHRFTDRTCPVGTVCRYRSRTRTELGASPWTTVSRRSMAEPTAVRSPSATSPRARTAVVAWEPPRADAGRPVDSYEIRVGTRIRYAGTARKATLDRLPAGRVAFEIRAVNRYGAGPWRTVTATVRS